MADAIGKFGAPQIDFNLPRVLRSLGNSLLTVGDGGHFPTLAEAVAAAGSRWVTSNYRTDYGQPLVAKGSFVGSFTNGSASFSWVSGEKFGFSGAATAKSGLAAQEFIQIDGEHYRVKTIDSDTTGTLWGTFKGTGAPTQYTCTPQVLDWVRIHFLDGEHADTNVILASGTLLTGSGRDSVSIIESASGTAFKFTPMTAMYGISIRPNNLYSSMDRIEYTDGTSAAGLCMPYGCSVLIDDSRLVFADVGGLHAGGVTGWPILPNGKFSVKNSEILLGNNTPAVIGGEVGVTGHMLFQNCEASIFKGLSNFTKGTAWIDTGFNEPVGTLIIDVVNCYSRYDDIAINPSVGFGPIGPFKITGTTADVTLNIIGGKHTVVNNNAAAAAAEFPNVVYCTGGTVNLEHTTLEATGSTVTGANQGTGVYVAGTGTVNVRTGARIKGDINATGTQGKAIRTAAAGATVNVSGNADLIGSTDASAGGTINAATAT